MCSFLKILLKYISPQTLNEIINAILVMWIVIENLSVLKKKKIRLWLVCVLCLYVWLLTWVNLKGEFKAI